LNSCVQRFSGLRPRPSKSGIAKPAPTPKSGRHGRRPWTSGSTSCAPG
jgi:hypothetical protein